jgi:thiol-disulfide isomerase/thioredoxin
MESIEYLATPLIGMACSAAVGLWYRRQRAIDLLPMLAKVAIGALLTARVAFILQHRDTYSTDLLAMLDFTDRGFSAMPGLFAALVIGTHATRQSTRARRPLTMAVITGLVAWMVGTVATLDFAPARTLMPLVEVRRLDGSPVQLRTFTNKPMVLNLWATWCPPCRREMPALQEAQRRHPDIAFVFVNQGEDIAAIQAYLAHEDLQIQNVFSDPNAAVAQRTGSSAYPTTLFFDSEGKLFMRQIGELDSAGLERRLSMLQDASRP